MWIFKLLRIFGGYHEYVTFCHIFYWKHRSRQNKIFEFPKTQHTHTIVNRVRTKTYDKLMTLHQLIFMVFILRFWLLIYFLLLFFKKLNVLDVQYGASYLAVVHKNTFYQETTNNGKYVYWIFCSFNFTDDLNTHFRRYTHTYILWNINSQNALLYDMTANKTKYISS